MVFPYSFDTSLQSLADFSFKLCRGCPDSLIRNNQLLGGTNIETIVFSSVLQQSFIAVFFNIADNIANLGLHLVSILARQR